MIAAQSPVFRESAVDDPGTRVCRGVSGRRSFGGTRVSGPAVPSTDAAAEHPDADSPIRPTVDAQRSWCRTTSQRLVAPLGLPHSAGTADDLMLIRDGAMVAGYLDQPAAVAASIPRSSQAVAG